MKYLPIDNRLFVENRRKFKAELPPNGIAVFNSSDIMPKSADGVRRFFQHSDIFYLSGIDQEETILVICPDAAEEKHREILFIRETNEKIATWEGQKLSMKEASDISGIRTVYWTSRFETLFNELALESDIIFLNTNEHLRADTTIQTRDDRFIHWCRERYPLHRYGRLAPILHRLRVVKSEMEIELIRQAVTITGKAFERLLNVIRPGIWEFELEAELYHEFMRNRSRGPAYDPIIASGADACVLHYIKNDKQLMDGDLVLMDFGAEYANYAADLTRTVPVNGKFTDRQKAVYDAVLRVQQEAIAMLVPGNTLKEYQKAVGRVMERELMGLGLLDPGEVADQDPEKPLYKQYFMHGTSHHMGLDVHDYGSRHQPFEAGMVLTCEPGIYIKKEWIGVRIENDILITEQGPVDLMDHIPVTAEDIEKRMAP